MIQFKKITVHNFGSYHHAEVDLQNRGFCLVSGQNNCKQDNAQSNGVGKSVIFSAICFALTGETVSGIKSGLKNLNAEENECWAQLEFFFDRDQYIVTRILTPSPDLKIIKNNTDISGKGIRESTKKLTAILPEVTKDLITSTVIIGQGLPNRFSSFSPSGRKELLEKLTKSDFMIEDLKDRIAKRQLDLSTKIREYEDSLIANSTQLNINSNKLDALKKEYNESTIPDFNSILSQLRQKQAQLVQQKEIVQSKISELTKKQTTVRTQLLQFTEAKAAENAEELALYNQKATELSVEKNTLEIQRNNLLVEIKKLKAITDVCPTCGQKLPNVQKPSTQKQEIEVQSLNESIAGNTEKFKKANLVHQQYLVEIDARHKQKLEAINKENSQINAEITNNRNQENQIITQLEKLQTQIDKQEYDKQHWALYIKKLKNEIRELEKGIASINNIISITTTAKTDLLERCAIVKKMDTLVKRDFRGYLLTNIITYLDKRAKEYSNIVFETDALSLALNGNALDITYCGKMFDLLSGGEKQRVDLILQLAIRDMLITYLGLEANILVLDEVTDFLDQKSCKAVMKLLENVLHSVESVFIVSHHSAELPIIVDSTLNIVKNEYGISSILE